MAIDITTEQIITLTEATRLSCFRPRRRGRGLSLQTIYRWTLHGCRGVVLESVQVGGTRVTSVEAIERFVERLSASRGLPGAQSAPRTTGQRERAVARAEQELEAAGI